MNESKLYRSAQATALRFLLARPRTRWEVEERLRQKGHDENVIRQVIDRLLQLDYLNDADFARRWLDAETKRKPQGRLILHHKLLQRGINREDAENIIESAYDRPAEMEAARTAVRRKLPLLAAGDREKLRGKLGQYLQRRGFDYSIILQVLAEVLDSCE